MVTTDFNVCTRTFCAIGVLARTTLTTNSIQFLPLEGEVRWGGHPTLNPKTNHIGDPA